MKFSFSDIADSIKAVLGTELFNILMNFSRVIIIILLSIAAVKIGSIIIRKFFEKQKTFKYGFDNKKVDTISTLLISVFKYAVYILAGVTILSDILGLKSVLATAGIGGVALGFGAQSLIKDVISGFFIVIEDQFAVGDLVTIDAMTGTVERLELRVTRLRSYNGDLYVVPNGEIKKVTNHTRGNKAVIVDIPLAYSSDINKAFETANNVCNMVKNQFETITEEPRVLGITNMDKFGMVVRIMAKTLPNEQWEVEREIRKLIKEEFEKNRLEFYDKNRVVVNEDAANGGDSGGR